MFGRQTSSKPSTATTKPSSSTTAPTNARSTTASTTSSSGKTPVVAKPGVASKRNSLDLKALSSTAPKPMPPIKITSFSAVNTPTVRSPITAKPPARAPTQPLTPTSGTRSARGSIGSRDQLVKASEPVKRTTTTPSKPTNARSAATAPSTPTRDTVRVLGRSGSIGGQSSRTATPLTSRSATPTTTTASSTKPAINSAKDPSRRLSVGATPSRIGPPAKAQTSTTIRSSTAPSSKNQSPVSSSPPTPRVTSRPSSVHLTGKDLPLSLRKVKTHTPTSSLTSPIPSSSPRSSFSSSSSSKPVAKGIVVKSQVSSISPIVPAPPALRLAQEKETNEFKEALVEKEATPQISPAETNDDDTPQLTALSPPLDEEEKDDNDNNYNDNSDSAGKAQNDDDGEFKDKEKQHQQHQHQVASTPPPSRTQESPPSPSTPTPTLQLFKEDNPEAVQSIEQQQEKQEENEEEPQEPQPIHQTIQIQHTMINNSELSKDDAIETMYAPEPAPFEPIDFFKEPEIVTATKKDLPALEDDAEAVVETTRIALVESEGAPISITGAIDGLEQMEEKDQDQEREEEEEDEEKEDEDEEEKIDVIVEAVEKPSLEVDEEIVKAIEGVVLASEESLKVEEEHVEQVEKGQEEEAAIVEEEEEEDSVLVVEIQENKQEQIEDVDTAVQNDQVAIEVEAVSASNDVNDLNDNEAVEAVEEPLPAIETQDGDQELELEAEITEAITEASVKSAKTGEKPELEVVEAPIEQEARTHSETEETPELEEVSLDSVASDTIESKVATIADEETKDVFPIEEEATFGALEAVSAVEKIEVATEDTLTDFTPLVESDMTIETIQDASAEESATEEKDVQEIDIVAQEKVAVIETQSDPTEESQALEIVEVVAVGENDVEETGIVPIEEGVAIDAIEEDVAIDTIDEDVEDTETAQSELESVDEQAAAYESESEVAETIVGDHIEIQELVKYAVSTEVEETQENFEPEQPPKKIEIDEVVHGFDESVEILEISIAESSLDGEAEAEKVIEVDEIPSESIILETEASLEVSETDASAEEIIPVVDQVDHTCVSHKFVWNHGGQSVKVTGTFDNWQASVDLQMNDDAFEATVGLDRTKVIHFKFVVDGQWLCASDLATEFDHSGNQNHVLDALA